MNRLIGILACVSLGCGNGDAHHESASHAASAETPSHEHSAEHHHAGHEHHAAAPLPPTDAPLPGTSLFQLESRWTDQSGAQFQLGSLRGKPTVVLMFYGSCTTMCPILVHDVQRLDESLPADVRNRVQYLLVTFDGEHDTPERMRALAAEDHLDLARYKLASGSDADVRELANLLGVQYRLTAPGEYAHSAIIHLLDSNGVFVMRTEGLGQAVEPMSTRIQSLLAAR